MAYWIISWDCGTYTDNDVVEAHNQDEANKVAKERWLEVWEEHDHWSAEPFNLHRADDLRIDTPEGYMKRQ